MIPTIVRLVPFSRALLPGLLLAIACGGGKTTMGKTTTADTSAPPAGTAPVTPSDDRPRIVALGTSLTAGYGLTDPALAYPTLLQQKIDSAGLRFRVVNAGVSGETSADAVRRVDWLLKEPAALVMIETGANDGLRGLDPDTLRANLQTLIARVRQQSPAPRILIIGMRALPNMGAAYVARFEKVYPDVAKADNLPLVPFLLDGVAGVERLNQADGVHPTPEGQRIAAANVWKVLGPMLTAPAK